MSKQSNKKAREHHDSVSISKKRKKPWIKMEINRIQLNPEQAVLGCCIIYTGPGYPPGYKVSRPHGIGQCHHACPGTGGATQYWQTTSS